MKWIIFLVLTFNLTVTFAQENNVIIKKALQKFGCNKQNPCNAVLYKGKNYFSVTVTKMSINDDGLLYAIVGNHVTYIYSLSGKLMETLPGE